MAHVMEAVVISGPRRGEIVNLDRDVDAPTEEEMKLLVRAAKEFCAVATELNRRLARLEKKMSRARSRSHACME